MAYSQSRGSPDFSGCIAFVMIERAGEAAKLSFAVHVHMLRHSTGYALAGRGMDTRRLQHFLGHASVTNTVRYTAMSPEPFKDIWR
jgi:site-specific recombinase XerD